MPHATFEPSSLIVGSAGAPDQPAATPTRVEDTTEADVADNAANDAADELIDQAEADPVVPGEPKDAHKDARRASAHP